MCLSILERLIVKTPETDVSAPNLKGLEGELIQIKVRQSEIDSEIAKLEEERSKLKDRKAKILILLVRERDRLDALVKETEEQESPLPLHKISREKLVDMSIDVLEFSVRTANSLKADNIHTIRDLLRRSENDLLKTPSLGRRGVNEIKEILASLGPTVGQLANSDK